MTLKTTLSPIQTGYHDVDIFVKVFAGSGERFRRGELKVPQLVLHAAVELVRILLALHVELDANGRIDADREVIVENRVRDAIARLGVFARLLVQNHLNLPSIHHHRSGSSDFLYDRPQPKPTEKQK